MEHVRACTTQSYEKSRSRAPVFVVGCGRSGTKFLYHTLFSAGGFAIYYSESNAFNLLGIRFGNLKYRRHRQKLLEVWLRSKLFQRSGLDPSEIQSRILCDCQNPGDLLRILMDTIAEKQGAVRWAESTPLHVLYLPVIKRLIPEALVIHIIRDGRDVAVSLNKMGWIRPFPWDRKRTVLVSALFWKWMVNKGRKYGRRIGADYMEVHYEDLVLHPRETLRRVGEFIDHDLDYERIRSAPLGSLQSPNSSFSSDETNRELSPVGRWKTLLSPSQLAEMESLVGDLLVDLGYSLSEFPPRLTKALRLMQVLYPLFFDVKLWLKSKTPLGRVAATGRMGISRT
jgi:Sulfotransferase family